MIAIRHAELMQIKSASNYLADALRIARSLNACDTVSTDAQRQRLDAAERHMERARATLANAANAALRGGS